jgi:hypothetical protein
MHITTALGLLHSTLATRLLPEQERFTGTAEAARQQANQCFQARRDVSVGGGAPAMADEARRVTISARQRWNDTDIVVMEGVRYLLTAEGSWTDWHLQCGPEGYSSPGLGLRLTERWRRVPEAPWFALIGSISRRRDCTVIVGASLRWTAPATGPLYCYANDLPCMYWNNIGAVTLVVERL